MNIKQIRLLAELLRQSDLSALEVCEGESKVRLERSLTVQAAMQAPIASAAGVPVSSDATALAPEEDTIDFNRLTEVKAPMVGVFYAAPAPDAAPYVKRGDRVKKGDVLCLIEAMKLLNEIVAEADGEIADICVQNGQVVEFSQTLFKLF